MSNLQNKLDEQELPFDKETVWEGIHKQPRTRPNWRPVFFVIALIGLLLAIFLKYERASLPSEPLKTIRHNSPTAQLSESKDLNASVENIHPFSGARAGQAEISARQLPDKDDRALYNISKQLDQEEVLSGKSLPDDLRKPTVENTIEEKKSNSGIVDMTSAPETSRSKKRIIADKKRITQHLGVEVQPLPAVALYAHFNRKDSVLALTAKDDHKIEVRRFKMRNRLLLEGGIGKHAAKFSASEPYPFNERESLEESQMDFRISLNYEREFRNKFYLSSSVGYTLFKDRIITEITRIDSISSQLLSSQTTHYDLHNHYHLLYGELGVGKHFPIRRFFGDVAIAIGGTYLSKIEGHFFDGSDLRELASAPDQYTGSTSFYWRGRLGAGMHWGENHIVKAGFQFHSPIRLTKNDSDWKHRLSAGNFYVGLGVCF